MGSPTIPSKSSPATREKLAPSTQDVLVPRDRKSTRLNSSHGYISYAVFCLKKKIGLGADVPSDRLNATIAQRAPAAAAELSRAERELELATVGEAEVLEMARRSHDLAYPLSMKESA